MMDQIVVRRSKNHIGDQIGDDTIVINTQTGAYYSLTPAAGALWAATDGRELAVDSEAAPVALALITEGILESENGAPSVAPIETELAYVKYTEMADILLADPIHEVDEDGWPKIR
jgi:hypothetical protein